MSFYVRLLGASCLLTAASISYVQAAEEKGVETIIVTAQKRSENLQSVPISVAAISPKQLESKNITDMQSLNASVPALSFTRAAGSGIIFIRGIGAANGEPDGEGAVATYVDGVYVASPNSNIFDFVAVDQVAVLKGPQGTLFGQNSTGGVIQITTRNPSLTTPSAEINVGYGNFQTWKVSGYASVPVSDKFAFNIAAVGTDQGKGWGKDVSTGQDTYRYNDKAVRVKFLYEPSDDTHVILTGDYDRANIGIPYRPVIGVTTFGQTINNIGYYDNLMGGGPLQILRTGGTSLTIDHNFGDFEFKSITAWHRVTGLEHDDLDLLAANLLQADIGDYAKSFSQEIHLASPDSAKFKWQVGSFYFDNKAGYQPVAVTGSIVGGGPINEWGLVGTQSISGFAQGTYPVTDALNLTAGLRFTHTWQTHWTHIDAGGVFLAPPGKAHATTNKPTWRLSADYQFNPDMMAYASYNRGVKNGGYSLLVPVQAGNDYFGPEQIDAYEIGTKLDLFNHKLRLDAAAFWYEYKHIQVQVNAGNGSALTESAGASRVKGAEIQLDAVPFENLTVSTGLAYLHARYTNFPNAIDYPNDGNGLPTLNDVKGRPAIFSPTWSGSTSVTYDVPMATGTLAITGTLNYTSKFSWVPTGTRFQEGYVLVNGNLRWTPESERFSVTIWGKNLNNKKYQQASVISPTGDYIRAAEPRTYGVTLGAKF